MNKELIKKYKTEFDHWLNGGEVLFFTWKWYNSKDNPGTTFNHSEPEKIKHYIINDEYVEFRKAGIEGKQLQVSYDSGKTWYDKKYSKISWNEKQWVRIKPDDQNSNEEWFWCANYCKLNSLSPFDSKSWDLAKAAYQIYIKSKEPQFKVGDWVTVSGPTGEFTEQISSINEDTYTLSRTNICYKSQATPWKPKPSEYIWDKHYGFCKVTTNCVTNGVTTLFNCIDPFNKALEFTVLLEDCQPFIGTLPTNLQD